jgi:excisionase family DNA binding protein
VFVDDAAALLGVSRRTIYYRIREGRLRTIRTRGGSQRILLESLEALIEEREAKRASGRAGSQTETLAFEVKALS